VHTYHGHVFHSYYGRGKTRLFLGIERWLARLATDRIVVISDQQRSEINGQFRVGRLAQFEIIPLGIDLSLYRDWASRRARFREELQVGPNEVLIGIVGRLTEIKNLRMFLDAAARLKDEPKARFLVIGDGALRGELETYADTLGLKERVSFLGTRHDPENFYPALEIVALTSLNEGTPLSLIEGMANARPVVATAVGGVIDLLGPETSDQLTGAQSRSVGIDQFQICQRGISVPSGNAAAFAAALKRLIDDEGLREELGQKGLEFVEKNYAKERLLTDMSTLYSELMVNAAVREADDDIKPAQTNPERMASPRTGR
jgi:glycosyltransferase involved in cell wall biosynthesis